MSTIALHGIERGFGNENAATRDLTVYEFTPSHVPWMLRKEYHWMRRQGTPRDVARWHTHRMIAMLSNGNAWKVRMVEWQLRGESGHGLAFHAGGRS